MAFSSALKAIAILALLSPSQAVFVSTGTTVALDGATYYISGSPVATISIQQNQLQVASIVAGLFPLTVVSTVSLTFTQSDLESTISDYTAIDDVFNSAFLENLYIQYTGTPSPNITFNPTVTQSGTAIIGTSTTLVLANGPYFISSTGAVYQVFLLYSDFAGAFTQPLVPGPDGNYTALPATLPGIQSPGVAVPSRLYYTVTAQKPLAGIRIGIKDIYDVAGVKTSDGNRAVYAFYPPKTANALPVQKLVDAGAVIVGKMKTSQFANGEEATADWVDYHSPFNPRGDGYQDPSSSSSGPGAGIGSYPWLDIALGSDTGGSIRGPSQVQGLFGNRPTHGLVNLTGVMPLAPPLDTAGFLTRDPVLWAKAAMILYDGLQFYTEYPKKIKTIGFPMAANTESNTVILNFLTSLTNFLSAKTTGIDIVDLWNRTKPTGADPSVLDLLNITYPILISQEQIQLVRDPLYTAYAAAHDGRLPFVDPAPLVRWAFGDSFPASALTDALTNKTLFMDWFATNVLPSNSTTCSDSLLLYIGNDAQSVNYRNQYLGPPQVPYGYANGRISSFTGVPDMVVPIGQASYFSTITNHTEYLPVAIDILAAKGCDGMIFDLVNELVDAGIVVPPLTGRTVKGGEILFRRDKVGRSHRSR